MHRQQLLHDLETYFASSLITPEELPFYDRFITFIRTHPDCFERTSVGHITSSAWIVNDEGLALLTHHKKLNIWVQLGGHNDGDPDCQAVALKEAQEESGMEDFSFLSLDIFDIDIHAIPGKCAYHYDIRYLLRAPLDEECTISDESHALAWVAHEKLSEYSNERSVLRLSEKFKKLFNQQNLHDGKL